MRLDLPDGAWAEVRDPKQVPERLRRPVSRAAAAAAATGFDAEHMATPEQIDAITSLNDHVIRALVASWSFEAEVSVESILDLPAAAYDALAAHAAKQVLALMPDFGPNPDPKAPTAS